MLDLGCNMPSLLASRAIVAFQPTKPQVVTSAYGYALSIDWTGVLLWVDFDGVAALDPELQALLSDPAVSAAEVVAEGWVGEDLEIAVDIVIAARRILLEDEETPDLGPISARGVLN